MSQTPNDVRVPARVVRWWREWVATYSHWSLREKIAGPIFFLLFITPPIFMVIAGWWLWLLILTALYVAVGIAYSRKADEFQPWDSISALFTVQGCLSLITVAVYVIVSLSALFTVVGWLGPVVYVATLVGTLVFFATGK